jgi:hypothetical protein
MMRTLGCWVLAAGLVLPPSMARAAVWTVDAEEPQVRVDISALGDGFEAVAKGINDEALGLVQQSGIDPSRVEVVLEWLDAAVFSYVIDVNVAPALEGTEVVSTRETCRNCTTDEIIAITLEHLAGVLATARAQDEEAERAAAEAAAAAAEEIESELPPPVLDDRRGGSIGSLGWAGVGLLATGAATAITGGVFLGLGERQAANFPTKLRDYRPPGIALVVTGGVALVAGAVLLGLGIRKSKKTRISVGFGPGSAGASLSGRF